MSLLSRLFGSKSDPKGPAGEEYKGFRIFPEPQKEGGQYRLAARIEKAVDGDTKIHNLIRADTIGGLDEATEASVAKAKQVIDEQGDQLFG